MITLKELALLLHTDREIVVVEQAGLKYFKNSDVLFYDSLNPLIANIEIYDKHVDWIDTDAHFTKEGEVEDCIKIKVI